MLSTGRSMAVLMTTSYYSVLVLPHLEYAAPIWDPHLIQDSNKLEKFVLKMCLKQGPC